MEELKMSDKNIFKAVSELELAGMKLAERNYYEARLAGIRDYDSGLYSANQRGEKRGEIKGKIEGKIEGEHSGKLTMFTNIVKKRFPDLIGKYRAKIFMMTNEELDQQALMIFDYPTQEDFEKALEALPMR
jgi:predicted transposase YdaD